MQCHTHPNESDYQATYCCHRYSTEMLLRAVVFRSLFVFFLTDIKEDASASKTKTDLHTYIYTSIHPSIQQPSRRARKVHLEIVMDGSPSSLADTKDVVAVACNAMQYNTIHHTHQHQQYRKRRTCLYIRNISPRITQPIINTNPYHSRVPL